MHISKTARRIYSIRSLMKLSRPVVVQRNVLLPICPIWAWPWAKNWYHWSPDLRAHFAEISGCIYPTRNSIASSIHVVLLCYEDSPHRDLPMGQKLVKSGTSGMHIFKQLDDFPHWNFLDLHLCTVMVICSFDPNKLSHRSERVSLKLLKSFLHSMEIFSNKGNL